MVSSPSNYRDGKSIRQSRCLGSVGGGGSRRVPGKIKQDAILPCLNRALLFPCCRDRVERDSISDCVNDLSTCVLNSEMRHKCHSLDKNVLVIRPAISRIKPAAGRSHDARIESVRGSHLFVSILS